MTSLESIEQTRYWKPEAQSKLLSMLQSSVTQRWRPFFCPNPACNGQPHCWPLDERECPYPYGHEWERDKGGTEDLILHNGAARCYHCGVLGHPMDEWIFTHARLDQRPPRWAARWLTLFVRSGRGTGKTRMGAEITSAVAKAGNVARISLIASTGPDLRATMVEGDSGILACAPPDFRPIWEPSKKQLTWPNGVIALGYSAEEPDRLRGPNSGFNWADEPAHWALVEQCWENMLYSLRKGKHIKILATSTPKPSKWVKAQIAHPLAIDRRVSSWENLTNLSEMYQVSVLDPKKGTRLGRQELDGEVLEDVEGALWSWDWIRHVDDDKVPDLSRIVVAIDPAGTANPRSDETGIIIEGTPNRKDLFVLGDRSGKFSPGTWARRALDAAEQFSADAVVYEKNYGGDMVLRTLEAEVKERGDNYVPPRFIDVTSRRGKAIRAEPIAAIYEKDRVRHVRRALSDGQERSLLEKLEDEMTTWVPGEGPSPNRVDAMVHGATNLIKAGGTYAVASPTDL